jgi:hypothetical protein
MTTEPKEKGGWVSVETVAEPEMDNASVLDTPEKGRVVWCEMYDTLRQGNPPDEALQTRFFFLMQVMQADPKLALDLIRSVSNDKRRSAVDRTFQDHVIVAEGLTQPPELDTYAERRFREARKRLGMPPRKSGRPAKKKA